MSSKHIHAGEDAAAAAAWSGKEKKKYAASTHPFFGAPLSFSLSLSPSLQSKSITVIDNSRDLKARQQQEKKTRRNGHVLVSLPRENTAPPFCVLTHSLTHSHSTTLHTTTLVPSLTLPSFPIHLKYSKQVKKSKEDLCCYAICVFSIIMCLLVRREGRMNKCRVG
jgi:hypothetical protein